MASQHSSGGMGIPKHRKSGRAQNDQHFSGPASGKRSRRKGKGLTRKQRRLKRGKHVNKYR